MRVPELPLSANVLDLVLKISLSNDAPETVVRTAAASKDIYQRLWKHESRTNFRFDVIARHRLLQVVRGETTFLDILLDATYDDDVEMLTLFLAREDAYANSHFLLQEAATSGSTRVMRLLMDDHGASLDDLLNEEKPMREAVRHPEVLKLLLDHRPRLDSRLGLIGGYQRAMVWAAEAGSAESVRLLLDRGGEKVYTGWTWESWNNSALRVAAQHGHYDVARLLLDRWEDQRADLPQCRIYVAAMWTSPDYHHTWKDAATIWKEEALCSAAERGHVAVVHLLLDRCAATDASSYDRSLRLAALNGHAAVVRVLLSRGADARRAFEKFPWHWEKFRGFVEVASLLM